MNLWIFGHSACTRHGLKNSDQSWMDIVADQYQVKNVHNLAEEASDNLRIYNNLMQNIININSCDLVVIGWSHPSRKSFVYNHENIIHQQLIKSDIICYNGDPAFFRSKNQLKKSWSLSGIKNFSNQHKIIHKNSFFDEWYKNYYSEHESNLNFRAYLDSARLSINAFYVPFYFSKESLPQYNNDDLYYLDLLLETKLYISAENLHANVIGHKLISTKLIEKIQNLLQSSK